MSELSAQFDEIIQRRRSNRKFDDQVSVPADVMKRSLERAILSPNSSNMQLWEFYWIQSKAEVEKFHPLCLGQNAAKTADQMVVFVTRKDLWKKRAKWNADMIRSGIKGELGKAEKKGLDYYTKLIPMAYASDPLGLMGLFRRVLCFFMGLRKPFVRMGGKSDQRVVVHKSCALAAQTFMLSIAAEGYETCPMEGFDEKRVKQHLGLPSGAEINMIISVGKGTEKGIWGERHRVPFDEVVFVR